MTELTLHVLLALADGPAHGYGIGKLVEERSDGRLGPTTGTLYQTLKRLSEDGFIRQVGAPRNARGDDERRNYVALTSAGRAAATAELSRLEAMVTMGRRALKAGAQ